MKHEDLFRRHFGDKLTADAVARLARHAAMLERWNRVVRLVGEVEPELWVRRHYAESLAAREFCGVGRSTDGDPRLLDLGSGGGFPGLVLAALAPDRPVTLVEARERKAAFLAEAARELGLARVQVVREHAGPELAARLATEVECVTLRGLRLAPATAARLVESLPDAGRVLVWGGGDIMPGLAETCTVEQQIDLSGRGRRRLFLLRPNRRG